jgi:hypothetical protein
MLSAPILLTVRSSLRTRPPRTASFACCPGSPEVADLRKLLGLAVARAWAG